MKSLPGNKAVDRYELGQWRYWEQLRYELQRYKEELGATNLELSEAMEISRQPLVSFMKGDRPDLPIQRFHLIRLWDRLTSPDFFPSRRLSDKCLSNRQMLRRAGPTRLLKSAGFLPDKEGTPLEVNSERFQQIQRIVSGLSNIPVRDDTDFVDLIDSLETEVISKAFGFKRMSPSVDKERFSHQEISAHGVNQWVNRWIKENLYMQPVSFIESRFKRAIAKLIRRGKYDLNDREIFELYLSILENNRIDKKTSNDCKIRVAQCQFTNLTFSILDSDMSGDQDFRDRLMNLFFRAEAKLQFSDIEDFQTTDPDGKERYLEGVIADVITEASVTCVFRIRDQVGERRECIRWTYSSSATHFENMFTAIYKGMGCEGALELVDFSTASLGKRSNSLVKSSTTFKSQGVGRLHQGVWVDSSSVVGTAQSVVVAVKSWLADNLPDADAYQAYYIACTAIADMDYSLGHGCKVLSDYVLHQREEDPLAAPARDYLSEEVISPNEKLRQQVLAPVPILQDWYGINLERKYGWAQIACARSSFVEGDLEKAAEFLVKATAVLDVPGVKEDIPLVLRLELEQMLQSFYSGEQSFINNRVWRKTLQPKLEALRKYIYGDQSSSAQRRYRGRLDVHTYLCASEIFARAGRLEFTFATAEEVRHLLQAADHLLMAAYYASKVGERQRTAHWLANASRVYCRLGDGGTADKLANIADRILKQAIDQRYSGQYKEAILAEVYISRGEKALLIDQDPLRALRYFGCALQGAAYLGFVRLLADSLYDVGRAAEGVEQPIDIGVLLGSYGNDQKRSSNHLVADAMDFLADLDVNVTWAEVAVQFKQQAQKIWHYWAVKMGGDQEGRHPIEDEIEYGCYLCPVS